ncbi:MAG: hypothetical protein ACRDP3_11160 [Streptomyces sp.]|uniref:hypothetical protein n=1 Tax=Streptomyces sp. TaxID=1931 RepID=UPI003D6C47E2
MSTEPSPADGGEGATPNSADSLDFSDISDTSEERPAPRRRRQLSVVAVATAVLLAGGGGAYWASSAGGGDSAGPGDKPAPLALDGIAAQQRGGSPGDGPEGIAPGEPHRQSYRATGELPDGPGSASVYRTKAGVPRDAVAALAKTLDVPGTPEKQDGRWVVGDSGGSDAPQGPALTVNNDRSTGNWTYQQQGSTGELPCARPLPTVPRDDGPSQGGGSGSISPSGPDDSSGSSDPDRSNTVCPSVPDSGKKGSPVSEREAKSAVRPALKTLKLTDAALDAKVTLGPLRMVTATPAVDGMPTRDWNSTFTVGPDGKVVRGHGNLGELSKGASYPVMTAKETLKHLNKQGAMGSSGVSSSVREPMRDTKNEKPASEAPPSAQPDPREPVKVTGADFGLVTHYAAGKPVLVPSWIYELDLRGGTHSARVAYPAVQPEFLKPTRPEQPGSGQSGSGRPGSDPGEAEEPGTTPIQAVKSYTAEGRTLKLTFWGGVCGGYTASADEGGTSAPVKVTVRPKKTDSKKVCIKIAKKQTVEVELGKALGDREVVDARDGEGVPRAK